MEKITSLPQRLRVLKVSFEAVIRELAERPGVRGWAELDGLIHSLPALVEAANTPTID